MHESRYLSVPSLHPPFEHFFRATSITVVLTTGHEVSANAFSVRWQPIAPCEVRGREDVFFCQETAILCADHLWARGTERQRIGHATSSLCQNHFLEAALQGATVCGGDSSPLALAAAQTNISAAGVEVCLQCWDAQALPLADATIDRVICNLPWGRQVRLEGTHATLYRRIVAEMRRVLAPAGRIVLLTNEPEEIDPLDLRCIQQLEISLFGQRPTILIFSHPRKE